MEQSPFRRAEGDEVQASIHQSANVVSGLGIVAVDRHQERTSCQIWREKGQEVNKWCMSSVVWSHSTQLSLWGSPRRARRSAVQHRSCKASQMNTLMRKGAQVFQVSFQDASVVDP